MDKTRIDRWVYSVRLLKTRTIAALAIENGKVKLNENTVKPSHSIKVNDVVSIKDGILYRKFKVLSLAQKRMSAKLASEYYVEITPISDLERLKEVQIAKRSFIHFTKGRPTKKDRRKIDKYLK